MEENKDQIGAAVRKSVDGMVSKQVSVADFGGDQEKFDDFVKFGGAAVRGEAVANQPSEAILGAVARGWCAPGCTDIEMDSVLAVAIAREIQAIWPVSVRAADAPSEPSEPPRLDTEQSREYLVAFMEQHFTDTTFHRYIRGQIGGSGPLAGDFAWQMARALRRIEAGVVKSRAADALDSQPTECPIPWEKRIPAHVRQIGTACSEIDYVKAELAEWRASSQPTDGGVRNG